MALSDLWASAPDPKMGVTAQVGLDRLTNSILGNTVNADGTVTHASWFGSTTTIDPSIPKTGVFGSNQVVSTGTVPGSFAASIDRSYQSIFQPVTDAVQKVTDTADTFTNNITQQISAGLTDAMGPYLIYGLFALGALLLVEGIA